MFDNINRKLLLGMEWRLVASMNLDLFAFIYTRTAVARLPLRQLGFLVSKSRM